MSEYTTHPTEARRLERPTDGRLLAGVAAGLGRYFDLSPAFFRLGFVVLTLLGGSGVLLYLAALLIIPEEGRRDSIAAQALATRRERPGAIIGLGLVAIALFVLITRASFWPAAGVGWVLILLAGLVILWRADARGGERRSRGILRAFLILCALGLVALIVMFATALAWFHVSLGAGIGDRYETPTTLAQLQPSYHLGIGNLRIDLSQLPPITQPTHVSARVDVGHLDIIVPAHAQVTVSAHARVGDVHVLQSHDNGHNVTVQTGNGLLSIDAKVGAGRIDVTRAGG